MTPSTTYHVQVDERGLAWIDDTNIKVIEVALEMIAHQSSVEEIYKQHQGYLSMGQIHAALAWYYDHQEEMDSEIQQQLQEFDKLRAQSLESPGRQKLRAMGKLP